MGWTLPTDPRDEWADPYAEWAKATAWRGFARSLGQSLAPDDPVRVLAAAPDDASRERAFAADWLQIPAMYRDPVPADRSRQPARHFTARLERRHLHRLSTELGLRWELSVPLRESLRAPEASPLGYFGTSRSEASLKSAQVLETPASPPAKPAPLGDTVAVVDFGCPFLNQAFEDPSGCTRVARLWDQDDDPHRLQPGWWQRPARTGYGRELDASQMQAACRQLQQAPVEQPIAETDAYRDIDYLVAYDDARRRVWQSTHGATVLHLAGGTEDPLASLREPPPGAAQRDAAGKAALVFVQLPALTAADSSGGSLGAQVLDAVRYVLDACKPDARIVINLSYGTFAGPHDGSSLIETALDELLERRKLNFAIVVAAGNARQAGCHVRRRVQADRSALLAVDLSAGDTTDTFVEVWYERPRAHAQALRARARWAGGPWSDWSAALDRPRAQVWRDPATGQPIAMLHHRQPQAPSSRACILLCLAPTARAPRDEGPLAPAGRWEIEVELDPAEQQRADAPWQLVLDAWVERDDPGSAWGSGPQSRFVAWDRGDDQNTLNSLATGRYPVVVGSWRLSDGVMPAYSSLPAPGIDGGLFVLGVGEQGAEWPGLRATAVVSGETTRASGTSVAAPVVARQLFNAMAGRRIDRDQWPEVLRKLCAESQRTLMRALAPSNRGEDRPPGR